MRFTRLAVTADRHRNRVRTHGEALPFTIADGMVVVETQRLDTAKALRKKGWVEVPESVVWVVDVDVDSAPVAELRAIAKALDIRGRSKMSRADIIAAIAEARG